MEDLRGVGKAVASRAEPTRRRRHDLTKNKLPYFFNVPFCGVFCLVKGLESRKVFERVKISEQRNERVCFPKGGILVLI